MHAAWAARLSGVARSHGWQPVSAMEPQSVLALLSSGRRGLVIADCEALAASPGLARGWVAKARKTAPGVAVILAGDDIHFGASLSRWLTAGADDLVQKSMTEKALGARLARQARRHAPPRTCLEAPGGAFRVDVSRGKLFVRLRGAWKESVPLSPKELALLCRFLEHPGAVLGRSLLLHALWPGRADRVNAETVDKHVGALRRKLGRHGRLITSVYGSGYRLGEG